MAQTNKQLELFDDTYPDRVDKLFSELEALVGAYKFMALTFEISLPKDTIAFERLKLAAVELVELMKVLAPHGKKSKTVTQNKYSDLATYQPYYVPLDERSPLDIYYLLLEYDLRSKRLIGHNRTILGDRGIAADLHIEEFYKLITQALASLKKKYGHGF